MKTQKKGRAARAAKRAAKKTKAFLTARAASEKYRVAVHRTAAALAQVETSVRVSESVRAEAEARKGAT